MQLTLEELAPEIYQKQKCTVLDFHARLSQLLENEEASQIQGALSFLKSCGWLKSESLIYYSPKMSRDFSVTIADEPSGPSTVSSNSFQDNNYLINECRIRKLTPKECFRLQGFPDEYFERAAFVNSDSQLYKQAGNSVTVNVIYEIARRL